MIKKLVMVVLAGVMCFSSVTTFGGTVKKTTTSSQTTDYSQLKIYDTENAIQYYEIKDGYVISKITGCTCPSTNISLDAVSYSEYMLDMNVLSHEREVSDKMIDNVTNLVKCNTLLGWNNFTKTCKEVYKNDEFMLNYDKNSSIYKNKHFNSFYGMMVHDNYYMSFRNGMNVLIQSKSGTQLSFNNAYTDYTNQTRIAIDAHMALVKYSSTIK